MSFLNREQNPNGLVGLFLLILLAVFAGPTVLPELLSTNLGFVDEGVQCGRLRLGEDRGSQQSLIGRAATSQNDPPVSLSVRTSSVSGGTADSTITISIIVTNDSIGTVPILVTPDTLILDPNIAQSGLGVVFNSAAPVPAIGETVGSYPASRIRLLGPRQTCVHRVRVTLGQIPNASSLTAENATVKAFYRNVSQGQATSSTTGQIIYTDQGLWAGVVESDQQPVGSTTP